MLSVENLTFSFSGKQLLNNLSLQVKKGERIALLGPSGSGKTTLFKLIAGLYPIQQGKIFIGGKSLDEGRDQISYMMQEDLLLPWRTAMKNALLPCEFAKKDQREEAEQIFAQVGLTGYEGYYPHELSVGMRQRVALIRALLLRRPILILDEAFSSVDYDRKEGLMKLVDEMVERYHLTLLFITHNPDEARYLSNKIYHLKEGGLHAS
ncbi:MAG: ABC transporter ATP-binding protein [Candidatus Algichlamydia australiensis]|nr:ABC transporter ATP-binding protein [Chlamydiales bacterium]